ncbi:MAG: putative motility protein [Tissierellia bacterium]|nr:putative motility protein [Tissierellia bacterium]
MDVGSISAMRLADVHMKAGVLVLKKAMDQSEIQQNMLASIMSQSLAVTQAMERSVNPHLGGNIDVRV